MIVRCWQLGDANPILFIHDVGAGGLSNAMPELVSDGGRGGKFELRDILSDRRCQEVIVRCWQLGDANPILFIHDVGAGGLSNAMPELVSDGGRGGKFELRDILSDEPGMSPLVGTPARIVPALDIMPEGPLGGAAFNNYFGRPALNGYFRTYEEKVNSHNGEELRGYHKPLMLAGGSGNIRADHVQTDEINVGAKLVVLGGPAMTIGRGGGAASSMASGQSDAELDFSSVQRDNPEMELRCQ